MTASAIRRRASRPTASTIAFVRDGTELRVLDLATKQERSLATGYLTRSDRGVAWSPDSQWVAYVGVSAASFRNVFAVPGAGGESRAVTTMPNGNANNVSWSPDGTYHHLQHQSADRGRPDRAGRSDPAHAALPRGSLPRSVQGRAAATRAEPAAHRAGQPDPAAHDPTAEREPAGAGDTLNATARATPPPRAIRRSRSRSSSTTFVSASASCRSASTSRRRRSAPTDDRCC